MSKVKVRGAGIALLLILEVFFSGTWRAACAERIGDIARVQGMTDNLLVGYGLVIGLPGTGDTSRSPFTRQSLVSALTRLGVNARALSSAIKGRNVAAVMVTASWFIGKHRNTAVKLEAYECGMVAQGDARGRFSVRFYMVAMLFILFDVEAVFMLPWAVIYRQLPALTGSRFFGFWEMLVYIGFVLVGFFYIWKKGILEWSKDKADL